MPYIKEEKRRDIYEIGTDAIECAGDLNYFFTGTIIRYIEKHGESYQTYNDIMGALEGCKLEVYRRLVSHYEDKKIIENGDVY